MISRLFIFGFGLLLLFSTSACQEIEANDAPISDKPGGKGVSVDEIVKRGKLIVSIDNNPTSYFIYRGQPMGYSYELLKDFADFLDVEIDVRIVNDINDEIDSITNLRADIAASGLTVLNHRKKRIDFSAPILSTRQILIQRLPENFKSLNREDREKPLIRILTELAGKTVYVQEGSSYLKRLQNLEEEIGDSIHIVTFSGDIDIDSLMNLVSKDSIQLAVTDEYMAQFYVRYYDNLDIKTPVSFSQNIAWAVPKDSPSLLDTLNYWISRNKRTTDWAVRYNRYFKRNSYMNRRVKSPYSLNVGGKISPYDEIIKHRANEIGWDWLMLAAVINVESEFNADTTSWSGAMGLMQIMPSTAEEFGVSREQLLDPELNIKAGTAYLKRLHRFWNEVLNDSTEAVKFALASYNVGLGHVLDARRLAEKQKLEANVWEGNVELMLLNLSNSLYYRDEVVKHGYCRGKEGYQYIKRIYHLYRNYRNFS